MQSLHSSPSGQSSTSAPSLNHHKYSKTSLLWQTLPNCRPEVQLVCGKHGRTYLVCGVRVSPGATQLTRML